MKIGPKPELPAALVQSGLAKPGKGGSTATSEVESAPKAGSKAGVPVTLSTAAQGLTATQASSGDFDAQKVAAVRAAIANGTFQVNADKVAGKMLENAQEVLTWARSA